MAKNNYLKIGLIGLLISIIGWGLFNLISMFFSDILTDFGITGKYSSVIGTILIAFVLLLILGVSFRKAIKRILK